MPPSPDPPPLSRRALLQRLESLQTAGVTHLPRAAAAATPVATDTPSVAQEPSAARADNQAGAPAGASARETATASLEGRFAELEDADREPVSSASTLEVLQAEIASCSLCEELAGTRTQTVFGVGDPNARLVFLGEAPGADEDRTGEPFVGRAGQLLNKIIEACTLRREEVYILNILKCRPPGNRNPTPGESANCKRFLRRQLDLIAPEYICCLGSVAAQNLLETPQSIGRLRGRLHDYRGVKVVCTYHPAYLLRNPSAKRDTWEDMQMLMRLMGVELGR